MTSRSAHRYKLDFLSIVSLDGSRLSARAQRLGKEAVGGGVERRAANGGAHESRRRDAAVRRRPVRGERFVSGPIDRRWRVIHEDRCDLAVQHSESAGAGSTASPSKPSSRRAGAAHWDHATRKRSTCRSEHCRVIRRARPRGPNLYEGPKVGGGAPARFLNQGCVTGHPPHRQLELACAWGAWCRAGCRPVSLPACACKPGYASARHCSGSSSPSQSAGRRFDSGRRFHLSHD
jgi:hypothetical protein